MSWLHGLLVTATRAATASPACARRLYEHMLATLVSPCRGTLTNLICLCGRAHLDWTADYRLYSHERVEPARLFAHALTEIHLHLPAEAALVAAIDDTLARKTGTKIDGVGWKRDPLGPAFQTNLVRGQRFVQLTAAWPGPDGQAPPHLQPPKWRQAARDRAAPALSTADLLRALRAELWTAQLSPQSFSHFTSPSSHDTNDQKLIPSLAHALLSAA